MQSKHTSLPTHDEAGTNILSKEWLDFVNEHFKKERIQMRDADVVYEDDQKLKTPKRFLLSGTVILSANTLAFFQCKSVSLNPTKANYSQTSALGRRP